MGTKYEKRFDDILEQVKKARHNAVEKGVSLIEADAKTTVNVDTGNLRRNITHNTESDDNKTVGEVGTNVEYAPYVERKYPFLEPSVDSNIGNIKKIIIDAMSDVK